MDWKTGRPPTGERAKAASVQLGVYRLAYARLRGLPLDAVRAAFYYVATGETVYPEVPGEDELVSIIDGSASPRSASPRAASPRSASPRSV